jgi:hypothetical protein
MTPLVITSVSGDDGVLRLAVPLGVEGKTAVRVTIDPLTRRPMSQAEWDQFVQRTAGSISDPTFKRGEEYTPWSES